ncbi:MAG: polysaccharide biosynthesis/export family protein, partial [Methylococcus sp.]
EKILWVDVGRLLAGDLTLDIKLQRNDVVYIPDAFDTSVYVLGYVGKPGAYRLTPQMSLLDALAQAGGPSEDSDRNHIHLIRPDKGVNLEVDLEELLTPDQKLIVALKEGDIIYVPRNGVEKFSYLLRKLSPFTQMLTIGATASAM